MLDVKQSSITLNVPTSGPGLTDITAKVVGWIRAQGFDEGLLTVFIRHTSASLLIQENADPDVLADLQTFFERLAPWDASAYRHTAEGEDDMPAHIRSALTQVSLSIPLTNARLALGTWQGIYVFEHRKAPQTRQVTLHLIGN